MDNSEDRDKDGDMEDIGKVRRGRPKGKGTSHLQILQEDVTSPVTSMRRTTSPTTWTPRQDE